MTSFDQALSTILQNISPLEVGDCDLRFAHRRVLAEDVHAAINVPPSDNSSMDGFALKSVNTSAASPEYNVELSIEGEVAAGEIFKGEVRDGSAVRIFTGAAIPSGADAVIEQERVKAVDGKIFLDMPVPKGRNIRIRGEDISRGQRVFEKGTPINAARLGVLASLGLSTVRVHAVPRVAILTTGNELTVVDGPLEEGKVRDSNSFTLWSLVRESGCESVWTGRAGDSSIDLKEKIETGLLYDSLITSGGVSVGSRDLVLRTLEELGVDVRFWKVNIKPGMPFAFGVYERDESARKIPVFALPGNPVSTMVTFLELVRPALLKMRGLKERSGRLKLLAKIEHEYEKRDGKRHFVRGVLRNENGELFVRITGSQSSGVLTSMATANCLIVIPEDATVIKVGNLVQVELLNEDDA